MRTLCFFLAMAVGRAFAVQWTNYGAFATDATNALANVGILMSDGYTNRLHLCRSECGPTNEMSSAALLLLAMSDDARSNCGEGFIGSTNALGRVGWFLSCPVQSRTLWQKACAITMLSTANREPAIAREHFAAATQALQQWDARGDCFFGGALYVSIARYFGAAELTPRQCLIFSAAVSAKRAGMKREFDDYSSLQPIETREFLSTDCWLKMEETGR